MIGEVNDGFQLARSVGDRDDFSSRPSHKGVTAYALLLHHILVNPRCLISRLAAPSWYSSAESTAELPLLAIL
jgi:hypothetical protein